MKVQLPSAIAADSRGQAVTPAGRPGLSDGVLDRAVGQPAGVAPVQALLPGLEELREGGQLGTLLLAGLLSSLEAHVVTTTRVLVGKHHPWVEELDTFNLKYLTQHQPALFWIIVTKAAA